MEKKADFYLVLKDTFFCPKECEINERFTLYQQRAVRRLFASGLKPTEISATLSISTFEVYRLLPKF